MDKSALYSLSYGLYVIGVAKGDGSYAGCVVDAVMQASGEDNPVVLLGVQKGNYTNGLIAEAGELTLSVLPASCDPLIVGIFGYQSARDGIDKWADTPKREYHGLPALEDACAWLYLKVEGATDLVTHTLFSCRVIDAQPGQGEPLGYADYRKNMRDVTAKAFGAYQKSRT